MIVMWCTALASHSPVIPADAYREVGGRAMQEAKAEAGIQEFWFVD